MYILFPLHVSNLVCATMFLKWRHFLQQVLAFYEEDANFLCYTLCLFFKYKCYINYS